MALRIRKNKAVIPHACPIDVGVKLLSGAWAPHVIWYLSQQPRRFGGFLKRHPQISARVLSARLREASQVRGVIRKTPLPTSPPSAEYALTNLGHSFSPALTALVGVAISIHGPPARGELTGRRARKRGGYWGLAANIRREQREDLACEGDAALCGFDGRIAGHGGNLDGGSGLGGLAASDGVDARLIASAVAAGAFGDVEAGALGGARGLIAQLRIADAGKLHGLKELDGTLIRNELVMGERPSGGRD